MPELLLVLDGSLQLLLIFAWLAAGWAVVGLPVAADRGTLRRRTWVAFALVGLALSLVGARIAVVAWLAPLGWWFVQERVVLGLPLVAVPAAAVLAFSVPVIWRLRGQARAVPPARLRRDAAHPVVGVPVRAATFGALFGFWLTYPATPAKIALFTALTAAATGLAWWRQAARYRRLEDPSPPVRMPLRFRALRAAGVVVGVGVVAAGLSVPAATASRLPDRMGMDHHAMDFGGGTEFGGGPESGGGSESGGHHSGHRATSVADLRGDKATGPVRRFTLTAQQKVVRLPSGRQVDAWTYNGQVPGPELRVRQGDVVEVTLVNQLPDTGVTLHWHGYDVPNGEDGVAGVTQDAVRLGGRFTYRFAATDPGSYWYHSHELSSESVARGLYGTLVVEPAAGLPEGTVDLTAAYHRFFDGARVIGGSDQPQRKRVTPGTPVRLRLINTDSSPEQFSLRGTPYRVVAVDGTDLHRPGELTGKRLRLAAGGRYDVAFTMPDAPVALSTMDETGPGLLLSPDGGTRRPAQGGPDGVLDLTSYGEPTRTPFGPGSDYDREFTQVLDEGMGFFDGEFAETYRVNGASYPDIPTMGVKYGELIKVTVVNRGFETHPMHPHGHHVLVLSVNGRPVTGSPLWMDTFDVQPGEVWVVGFKADNPGMWMDHCHNLHHARAGLMLHLAYEGVSSPYQVGRETGNHPE
ncbi:MAG: multicopper oxidase domain-containing protein [Micromonosporaceae bacterium]